ncbi:dTDP-4-dehydrorhamnose reductase [Meridianimarinicoccus aquatilis]|uniref:dTDP-4-dehydrorhamnose reductase n=1 Tax=Meridianimarinicoccus aquatilis TaxID=2552766 RepID=A0A4V3BCD3_9RHOB|nr:dTDP-4-dehydrorhamnose reductase [Fluviibacterium aquatile]TDL90549.1 dTDP-4-dehydrorhamnose reductase [Fluviibacterium aquatile]
MKFLVFGKSGQLGIELQRRAGAHVLDVRDEFEADFTQPETCAQMVTDSDAQAVIIAAAYTAVDKAETDEELALAVNGTTPGAIARAAAEKGVPVVLVSTDYVFDGSGEQPFSVDAPTGPLGAYGRTKLVGELAVRGTEGPHAILRTSWVVSAHGNNFIKTMLRLGAERDQLTIVADQIGGPTPAADLADACLLAAERLVTDATVSGTYHVTGGPDVSWADFAREIFRQAGVTCEVVDIPSSSYPTPARRPRNSRLDNSLTEEVFGLPRPDWHAGLTDILNDLGAIAK